MDPRTLAAWRIAVAGCLIFLASLALAALAPGETTRTVRVDFTPDTPPAGTIPGAA